MIVAVVSRFGIDWAPAYVDPVDSYNGRREAVPTTESFLSRRENE